MLPKTHYFNEIGPPKRSDRYDVMILLFADFCRRCIVKRSERRRKGGFTFALLRNNIEVLFDFFPSDEKTYFSPQVLWSVLLKTEEEEEHGTAKTFVHSRCSQWNELFVVTIIMIMKRNLHLNYLVRPLT